MKCYQITGPDGGKSFLLCERLGLHHQKIFERNGCVIEELTTGFGNPVCRAPLEASDLRPWNNDRYSSLLEGKTQAELFEMLDPANIDKYIP